MFTNLLSSSGFSKAFDVSILGNSANLLELTRLGIVGGTGILSLAQGIAGLLKNGLGVSLDKWGASETLIRGDGKTSIVTTGVSSRTSSSMYVGDTTSATQRSIAQAKEDYAQYSGSKEEESITKLIETRVETHLSNIYTLLTE